MRQFPLEIIGPNDILFKGQIEKLFVIASLGALEILYGHLPFVAVLKAGPIYYIGDNKEETFYLSGGLLAVQEERTLILAHTAIRAQEIDEFKVLAAKEQAELALLQRNSHFDYEKAQAQLIEAVAQLKLLRKIKDTT